MPWIASTLVHGVQFRRHPRGCRRRIGQRRKRCADAATRTRGILPKDSSEQYELTFWDSIKDSNYPSDYEAYLKAYPTVVSRRSRRRASSGCAPLARKSAAPASRARAGPSQPHRRLRRSCRKPVPRVQAGTAAPRRRSATTPAARAVRRRRKPRAAARLKDCPTCPMLIPLAAGTFTMGSNSDDPAEKPPHRVAIGQPFADRQIRSHRRAVERMRGRGACTSIAIDGNPPNNSPMRNVSWDDAQVYVKWLTQGGRQVVPPAHRGRMGIRGARRHVDRLLVGRPDEEGQRGLQGLRRSVDDRRTGCGRLVRGESVWPLRHERQRLGMGRRLLAQLLQGRARRRPRAGTILRVPCG